MDFQKIKTLTIDLLALELFTFDSAWSNGRAKLCLNVKAMNTVIKQQR
jgi:hypothetical protein